MLAIDTTAANLVPVVVSSPDFVGASAPQHPAFIPVNPAHPLQPITAAAPSFGHPVQVLSSAAAGQPLLQQVSVPQIGIKVPLGFTYVPVFEQYFSEILADVRQLFLSGASAW